MNQIDWGGEYGSFTSYLESNGIIHRNSCPHSHEQNRVADRKHCQIVENGFTLLGQASMPREAYRTAVFLYNRLQNSLLNWKSPLEVMFETKPDYSMLKTFGYSCFPNTHRYNSYKLVFRSVECTFLGYSLNHKGYKCLDKSGRIYVSRDFLFNELSFPFQSKFSSDATTSSFSVPQVSSLIHTLAPVDPTVSELPNPKERQIVQQLTSVNSLAVPNVSSRGAAPAHKPAVPTHRIKTRAQDGIFKPKVSAAALEPATVEYASQPKQWKVLCKMNLQS